MPPSKKQKTSENSSAPTQQGEPESSTSHKNHSKTRDPTTIPPHEYVCVHRPHFDYEVQNRLDGSELEHDERFEKYAQDFAEETKKGVILEPAKDHPDWGWTMLFEGWKLFCDYRRRANYCDPDRFGMHIYTDWNGWGLQELMENWILAFDAIFKKKDDDTSLFQMWAVVSGLGLWLNEVDLGDFLGCALLAALAALDHAEELKTDSGFVDLPKVISSFLLWSSDLGSYGFKDHSIAWRPHAAAYFKKAKLEASMGVSSTAKLLEKLDDGDAEKSGKDPWEWTKVLKKYKKNHGSPKIGGTKHDITKMTRKERAEYAYDNKDPLKDFSEKDLKAGNLDIA